MEKFTDKSCSDFIAALASSSPTPGGGGASALVGAVGVALGNMVGSLTVGKKKYADVQEEILMLKEKSDALQHKLLSLVERDAEVFAPLARAYGLPSETEEQRKEKAIVMESALLAASSVPLEIMELCAQALSVVKRFSQIGSKIAVSDAGCAAACCRAALCAASLNVLINTKSMKDRIRAEELNARTEALVSGGVSDADEIFTYVQSLLR